MSDMPIQFRKTKSGTWAVMGPVGPLQAAVDTDGEVTVTKKDGSTTTFTVLSLGKPFEREGVQCCYGYDRPQDPGAYIAVDSNNQASAPTSDPGPGGPSEHQYAPGEEPF